MAVIERYGKYSRRRRRRAARKHQRLDVQGLRMVAVLTVFACHLWGWPSGGFVGVDVFFVISGFLITGNLLRTAEATGTVSFKEFYWNRVRRIVPAATVVLVVTYLAAVLVFLPFRSQQVGLDAIAAFLFFANWRFAMQGTDYFAQGEAVSPIQHYWSLSIEEQFYFVWPALIFLVSVIAIRKAWTHANRMQLAGGVMSVIVAASIGWALYLTTISPTWAYSNTFARVWELGVGALLAASVGLLAKIPAAVKPVLSWVGLSLIGASLFLLSDGAVGFPAPWALLPVTGAALVIAAGVGGEPKFQGLLRNPVSGYIGDISYSLYLVHWPVIVFLEALMDPGWHLSLAVVALGFGLSIASYHFVENPLRHSSGQKIREAAQEIRRRRYRAQRQSQYAAVAALSLVALTFCAYAMRPAVQHQLPPTINASPPGSINPAEIKPVVGPLTSALQREIAQALTATEWPQLDPSMEVAMRSAESPPEVHACNTVDPLDGRGCAWGSPTAPIRMVIVGDSVALSYTGPLRTLALNSHGQIQVHVAAMGGCAFANTLMFNPDQSVVDACPTRTQRAVELINSTKPNVVVIANLYGVKHPVGTDRSMTTQEWSNSLQQMIEKFRANTEKVVLLSAPPAEKNIRECFGRKSSLPANCISEVNDTWQSMAWAEQNVAAAVGGTWIDALPWFCSGGYCPSFVGSPPTKLDINHMTTAYGQRIYPAIGESFTAAGIF